MSLGNKTIMSNNIKYYMNKQGIDRNKLCQDLTLPYMTVSDWINAKSYPRIDKIELLANYFKIRKSDLVEKHTDDNTIISEIKDAVLNLNTHRQQVVLDIVKAQLTEQQEEEKKTVIKEATTEYKVKKKKRLYTIDVVEKLAAGYGHYLADTPQEYTAIIDINPNTLPSYNYASLVSGDSMLPDYEEGDIVLISQGYDFQNGYVYALIYEDESYLKKVYIENNYIILKSLNPNYKDIKIKTGENLDIGLRIIGRVIHSLKPLNVKNKY